MSKSYITEYIKYLPDIKENDIIYYDMPSFCSGEYCAKVYKDEYGLYILKKNNFFNSAYDFRLNKPYWSKEYQKGEID